jgi:hypothetical protein
MLVILIVKEKEDGLVGGLILISLGVRGGEGVVNLASCAYLNNSRSLRSIFTKARTFVLARLKR